MKSLRKTGLVSQLSSDFVTHQALENYLFGEVHVGNALAASSDALIQARVDAESPNGERNALAMFSVGEHVFERDQMDDLSNGTVLGLRRRNMVGNEGRSVLRLAAKTKSSETPSTLGANIAWQLEQDNGVDADAGWLGFNWTSATAGSATARFHLGVLGGSVLTMVRATNAYWSFDPLNDGMNLAVGTESPLARFHVVDGGLASTFGDPASLGLPRTTLLSSDTTSPVSSRLTFGTDGTGWQFRIAQNNGGTITDWLTVATGGNVGVGTTSPRGRFHVHDTGTAAFLYLSNGNTGSTSSDGSYLLIGSDGSMNIMNLESAEMRFGTASANRWRILANGSFIADGLAGQGNGTINAQAVYDNGSLLTDWVFDLALDGMTRESELSGTKRLWSVSEISEYVKENRHLPAMPSREEWEKGPSSLGVLVNGLWETVEQQQLQIIELQKQLDGVN